MSPYSKVAWRDGMFLLPQHFQQAERSLEATLRTQLMAPRPLGWGVLELSINESAIREGRVELERCRAVLPDGTAVDIPDVDMAPAAAPLRFGADERRVEVFLCLPTRRARLPVFTANAERAEIRFVLRPLEVADDENPDRAETIDVAVKNLRLGIGGVHEGTVALKLAEVKRTEEGILALCRDYVPPSPLLQAAPGLIGRVKELIARIAAKVEELTLRREQEGEALVFDSAMLIKFWLLHTLNQYLPVLRHLVNLPGVHPAELYAELVRLGGALLIFTPGARPDFPAYQHEAIGSCYGTLLSRLTELLFIVVRERYAAIRLIRTQNAWDGRIDETALLETGEFYLVATGDLPRKEFERLPGACKIADSQRVESLVLTANPGLRMEPVPRPREPIPVRKDASYYRIYSEGPLWDEIRRSGQIGLFIPRAPDGLHLELVVLRDAIGKGR